jgi:hypothetical protein
VLDKVTYSVKDGGQMAGFKNPLPLTSEGTEGVCPGIFMSTSWCLPGLPWEVVEEGTFFFFHVTL